MALADHFDEADILASLSWVGMTQEARVAKLASLYLDNEREIRDQHRSYKGPTMGVVSLFVKSYFKPAHGLGVVIYESVIAEIPKQRKLRDERKANPRWHWPVDDPRFKKRRLAVRRAAVARTRYGVRIKCYDDKWEVGDINCTAITTINGCLMLIDRGARKVQPRIYLRNPEGSVKVIVLDITRQDQFSATAALLRLAPKAALRGMFGGKPITLDFEGEGFLVNGESIPWRNVRKVYNGSEQAMLTEGTPEKAREV